MTTNGRLGSEVESLRRQLADAEQTIKALAGGEIDAVVHGGLTKPVLLLQAQEQLRQREQVFRAIFEGVEDGILLLDSEGVFLDANPAACALLGAEKPKVVGGRTEDFAAPGYDVVAERQLIVAAGQLKGVLPIQLPDGSLRELEYQATREILPGLHLSVLRDVTQLNRARNALVTSEKKYRQIVDTAREGIWLIDDQSRTTFANRALEKMLGYAPGEMLGKSVFEFLDGEGRARTEQSLARRRQGVSERQDQKYLHKDGTPVWVLMEASPMLDDAGNYSGGLAMVTNVTDRKRAEDDLRASEERYRLLFDGCPLPIWLTDVSSLRFIEVNQAALDLFAYEREEFLRLDVGALVSRDELLRVEQDLIDSLARGVQQRSRRAVKKNGVVVELAGTSQTFLLGDRQVALVIVQDMTERNRLEAQLTQSRKMEAIGILAGGVAHDFNNLLSIMVTYTAFALEALAPGAPLRADIEEVAKAGERAVSLVRQLLAFSRQQILEPTILDLNATLAAIEPMLRRLVGENIELLTVMEPALGRISADSGQIEQVIMNLVVNARDAMPTGGELTIETTNATVADRRPDSHAGVRPGAYVKLTVSDTGSGIAAATKEHIFEPFFTTKGVGKGTGLGLSTVLGIVQQSGGQVELDSELGKGSRFEIYLPRVDEPLTPMRAPSVGPTAGGPETVLLVEDDEQVRALCRAILRRNGYEVLMASNAGEAFLIAEQHAGPIHLLLTDVVMPRMNGRQLAERLASSRPDMKVLFMTGYTDDTVVRQGVFDSDMALLQKPITPEALARRVRAVLDGTARGVGR
jgi:two-component system, cell cycle sensor histidine kinase and response regulator CckA